MNSLLRLAVVCSLFAGASLTARELSPPDRDRALSHLEKTRDALISATANLSTEQWSFKPSPDRWSVAEVTEHIASSEDFLRDMITEKVMTAPARTEAADLESLDTFVLTAIADRTQRVQAPEPLAPSNRFGSPEEALKHFKSSRAKTVQLLTDAKGLRDHAVDSPLGQKLDGYQWILFLSAHAERHIKQLNEVKAHENFPKK